MEGRAAKAGRGKVRGGEIARRERENGRSRGRKGRRGGP